MPTISALARRVHLSRSTLLYYDRIGLLRPSGRTSKAYREYGEAEVARLEQICLYRRAGVPLADIRRLLEGPEQALAPILERHLQNLEQEIHQLQARQRLIAGLLRNPSLLESHTAMDKATWVSLLRASGFSEADMDRWHIAFETTDPAGHQRFLAFLGLSGEEVAAIRGWSAQGVAPG